MHVFAAHHIAAISAAIVFSNMGIVLNAVATMSMLLAAGQVP